MITPFKDIVIPKPWGYEYLLYQNKDVALWYLYIIKDQETSLHAHPNKKTGLVVLSGQAKISFLSNSTIHNPADKVMIRHGVFHKTHAVDTNIEILEVETPVDKEDIIRLKDQYGRAGMPYESNDRYTQHVDRYKLNYGMNNIGECKINICRVYSAQDIYNLKADKILVLKGYVYLNKNIIVGPGDILEHKNLRLMIENFNMKPMLIMEIN